MLLTETPTKRTNAPSLTVSHRARALSPMSLPSLLGVGSVTRRVPMRIFPQEIRNLDRKLVGRLVATVPEYGEVNTLETTISTIKGEKR